MKAISFIIKPKKVGQITIKVTATCLLAGDSVQRTIDVEPDGISQTETKSLFFDLRETPNFVTDLSLDIPLDIIPDSANVEISVAGKLGFSLV